MLCYDSLCLFLQARVVCGHGVDFDLERERLLVMIPKAIEENDLLGEINQKRVPGEDRSVLCEEILEFHGRQMAGKDWGNPQSQILTQILSRILN